MLGADLHPHFQNNQFLPHYCDAFTAVSISDHTEQVDQITVDIVHHSTSAGGLEQSAAPAVEYFGVTGVKENSTREPKRSLPSDGMISAVLSKAYF